MPITKSGSTITYSAPQNKRFFDETGVVQSNDFAICDSVDELKQIKFDASAMSTNTSATITVPAGVTGAVTVYSADTSGKKTTWTGNWSPNTLTTGTSTTPSATTVYLTQIYVGAACSITGIKINNGATVGTDKYIVALFNSAGTSVANSALAGTTTAGADAYQAIAFTAAYTAVPGVYWIALYVNSTTDRFRTIPAAGEFGGFAGSVTGQTFGTVAAVTLPTTFTADKGPVAFTY